MRTAKRAAKRKRLPRLTIRSETIAATLPQRSAAERKERLLYEAHCRTTSLREGTTAPRLAGTLSALSMSIGDALGFISLALVQSRKELLAIEQKLEPPMEANARFLCELRECLVIAGEVVKRRACAGLSHDAESDVLHMPLPGLAGIIGHTRRELLAHLCMFLHEDCCEWVRTVAQEVGDEVELALLESLVIAEQVCSAEGLGNDLDEVEGDAWHPTELQRETTVQKCRSLSRAAVA